MSESPLVASISYHAWNKDQSQLAIAPNTDEVFIYSTPGTDISQWKRIHTLAEHAGLVSGIDWSPVTDLIVTCSHDRNAYVWRYDDKSAQWKPTLVILRINRAATSVKWSPNGAKFAVGSGAKCVPVCHFEPSNDWWISKMIKKHKSTVTSLAWSPNSAFLVTGSTDLKIRIFSAFLDNIDNESAVADYDHFGAKSKDSLTEFGSCLAEFDGGHAWIHSVSWSLSGTYIAASSHASILSIITLAKGAEPQQQSVWYKTLPLIDLLFVSDTTLVAAGFDGEMYIFANSGGQWAFKEKVESKPATGASGAAGKAGAGISSARAMFTAAADQGKSVFSAAGNTSLAKTDASSARHVNAITNVQYNAAKKSITTAGLDGRVCTWDISSYA